MGKINECMHNFLNTLSMENIKEIKKFKRALE
jgi:hypothetical protein